MQAIAPIMLSALEHYEYCARQCALILVDGLWGDNEHTVRGQHFHRRVDSGKNTTERGVKTLRSLRLWSERYGLTGRADVVEIRDGVYRQWSSRPAIAMAALLTFRSVRKRCASKRCSTFTFLRGLSGLVDVGAESRSYSMTNSAHTPLRLSTRFVPCLQPRCFHQRITMSGAPIVNFMLPASPNGLLRRHGRLSATSTVTSLGTQHETR